MEENEEGMMSLALIHSNRMPSAPWTAAIVPHALSEEKSKQEAQSTSNKKTRNVMAGGGESSTAAVGNKD